MRRTLFMAGLWLLLCAPSWAQTLGTITGEVKDSSGAVIPGVVVTVVNKATNATRTSISNAVGLFDFPALPPGPYSVKGEIEGFKTVTRDLELQVQATVRVDLAMELGTISEMATVTGVSPLVETTNATVGTVIENRRIVELPLNGRNYLQLVALSPNVSADFAGPGQAGDRQGGTRSNQQLSVSGQRREFNYYTLDGVDNTDVNFNTYIFQPSVDALEEFKVQTGVYSAEFGREASQVNVVTKSGTNSLHGTVFEFFRNDALDARPYAFNAAQAAAPKAPFNWNQYGYTAGGPVLKNRLFFLSNWEGYNDRKQFQTLYSTASKAMRGGDFSELLGSLGAINPQTGQRTGIVVDPAQCTVVGTTRTCAPFPGNIIPASRLDATSRQLLEFFPEPNTSSGGLTNNYLALQDRVIDKYQYTQRMDFVQSSKMALMGRYSYATENETMPALQLNGTKLDTHIHQVAIGHTWTVSPTVVNEFRFGYNYFFNTFGRELANVRDVNKELNIPGLMDPPAEAWGIPQVAITGFSTFGDNTEGPYTNRNHAFEFNDNLSWIRGRHALKFGGSFRYDHYNQNGNQFARGSFQFQNIATGYAFADYMLGYTQQNEAAVALAVTKFRAVSQAYYFTDTWRVRSNMTFDLGLRYEYTPPWFDANGTLMNASLPCHDTTPNVSNPACHPVLVRIGSGDVYQDTVLRFAPNIQVARDGRLGDNLVGDDKKNFAPRVGWAFTPSDKWSVRAGAGIFYMQDTGNPRFDMARNLSGRRRDNTLLLTPDLTFRAAVQRRRDQQRLRRGAAARVSDQRLRPRQHAGSQDAVHAAVSLQRPAGTRGLDGDRSGLPRVAQLPAGAHVRLERDDTVGQRVRAEPQAVSGVHQGPGDRQRRRGPLQFARRQADPPAAPGLVGSRRLHVFEVDGQRQRHSHPQRRHAVPAEQLLPRLRVGAVGVRRAPPPDGVGPLRAAVRPRQAVPAGRCRRRRPRRLAGQHDHLDLERVPAHGLRRHRSIEYRRRAGSSECDRSGSDAAGRSAVDCAMVQHRRVRAAAVGLVRQRRPQHVYRSRDHQRRCVDHPQLPHGGQ